MGPGFHRPPKIYHARLPRRLKESRRGKREVVAAAKSGHALGWTDSKCRLLDVNRCPSVARDLALGAAGRKGGLVLNSAAICGPCVWLFAERPCTPERNPSTKRALSPDGCGRH